MTQNSAPTGEAAADGEPRLQAVPDPGVDPDGAGQPVLALADEHARPFGVEVVLDQRERLADPQSGAPQHVDESAHPLPVRCLVALGEDAEDLLRGRRRRRELAALVLGRAALVEARQRRG